MVQLTKLPYSNLRVVCGNPLPKYKIIIRFVIACNMQKTLKPTQYQPGMKTGQCTLLLQSHFQKGAFLRNFQRIEVCFDKEQKILPPLIRIKFEIN